MSERATKQDKLGNCNLTQEPELPSTEEILTREDPFGATCRTFKVSARQHQELVDRLGFQPEKEKGGFHGERISENEYLVRHSSGGSAQSISRPAAQKEAEDRQPVCAPMDLSCQEDERLSQQKYLSGTLSDKLEQCDGIQESRDIWETTGKMVASLYRVPYEEADERKELEGALPECSDLADVVKERFLRTMREHTESQGVDPGTADQMAQVIQAMKLGIVSSYPDVPGEDKPKTDSYVDGFEGMVNYDPADLYDKYLAGLRSDYTNKREQLLSAGYQNFPALENGVSPTELFEAYESIYQTWNERNARMRMDYSI